MIVNDVYLFYVSYAQQLQMFHLVLLYEKEVGLICHRKKNSELEKGIDWIYSIEYYWRNKDKVDKKVSV